MIVKDWECNGSLPTTRSDNDDDDDDDDYTYRYPGFNNINVKKTTVLNTLVTMTMTSDVENSKN